MPKCQWILRRPIPDRMGGLTSLDGLRKMAPKSDPIQELAAGLSFP